MSNGNNIQDELNGLNSNLSHNQNGTPYSVPDGYFEGLAGTILAKIKGEPAISASEEIAQLSPLLAGISRKMPFSVPDDYFQKTLELLPILTYESEESIVLSFIDKTMPYDVPANYFENLPEKILSRVVKPKAKIVPMMARKWMRMAVAAVVAGIMAVSGFYYFGGKKNTVTTDSSVASSLKNVSDKALNDFINIAAPSVSDSTQTASNNLTASGKDAKKLLQDVSDKDLSSFLAQVPADDQE